MPLGLAGPARPLGQRRPTFQFVQRPLQAKLGALCPTAKGPGDHPPAERHWQHGERSNQQWCAARLITPTITAPVNARPVPPPTIALRDLRSDAASVT